MEWFENFATASPVAYSILLLSLVAVVGLGFASIKIRGIGLGVTGVLFAGLIFGHFGFHLEHHTLEFLREFGLILFVFTIGLQIGPGFVASLRDQGLVLNSLAAAIVIGGGILTVIFAEIFGIGSGAAAGLFSGATTNTPSLGAAQQTLMGMNVDESLSGIPALSYAVAYPLGIVGIIVSMILVRVLFRVDVKEEVAQFEKSQRSGGQPIERSNLRVDNRESRRLADRLNPRPARNRGNRVALEAARRVGSARRDRRVSDPYGRCAARGGHRASS